MPGAMGDFGVPASRVSLRSLSVSLSVCLFLSPSLCLQSLHTLSLSLYMYTCLDFYVSLRSLSLSLSTYTCIWISMSL